MAPLALDTGLGIDVNLVCRVLILQLSVSYGECERLNYSALPLLPIPHMKKTGEDQIRNAFEVCITHVSTTLGKSGPGLWRSDVPLPHLFVHARTCGIHVVYVCG